MDSTATKLLRAVIAKSFVEVVLVCFVVSLAAFTTFSPQLRGAIDVADQTQISGWVNDPRLPDRALEVQLFIDGKFIASKLAADRREDLVSAGVTEKPNHGFSIELEPFKLPAGEHFAQVFAVRDAAGTSKILLPVTAAPRKFQISR